MVVADAPAAFGTFRGTIIKSAFAGLFVMTNNVGFTTSSFHFMSDHSFSAFASSFACAQRSFSTHFGSLYILKIVIAPLPERSFRPERNGTALPPGGQLQFREM